jgi:hypothetical protein
MWYGRPLSEKVKCVEKKCGTVTAIDAFCISNVPLA